MKTIKQYRNWIEQQKGKKELLEKSIVEKREELKISKKQVIRHEKAKIIAREIGMQMQQRLQYHISEITSLALEAVFDNPYKLSVTFVERRGKLECDLMFSKNGNEFDPLDSTGGGAVDVASFALRIASWSLQSNKLQNVIILDEPLRFLSEDYREKASAMIKELSVKLGIQFIIITHDPTLAVHSDKTFVVSKSKKVSKVD